MQHRRNKFADGALGAALDQLFLAGDALDLKTNGRIARICRLLELMPGSDSAQDMVHGMLDPLAESPILADVVKRVRKQLIPRKTPPGVFTQEE